PRGCRRRARRSAPWVRRGRRRRARSLPAGGLRAGRDESVSTLPADVADLIGEVQYEEAGEFPVERGYVWTACSSVENGNPLFWDDGVAAALTGGPVGPPAMPS